MKTVVLDDDPTGTQSATDALVLLSWDRTTLLETLRERPSVYLQTNSRAISQEQAVRLCQQIRAQVIYASEQLGERILVVLRGDSTLRGHVFAESDVFATDVQSSTLGSQGTPSSQQSVPSALQAQQAGSPVLFVPAFPRGGRRTEAGVHTVDIGGVATPAGQTEYAKDPVFGFTSSRLVDYVHEKGQREARALSLQALRESQGAALTQALLEAKPAEFVVPDAQTDEDIALIHRALEAALEHRDIVVRCAAPLAAMCAGVYRPQLLAPPLANSAGSTLIVCGSHTSGACAQLERVRERGVHSVFVRTEAALADPGQEAQRVAELARVILAEERVAVICTERERRAQDDTLRHGELVMQALIGAAETLAKYATVVISKGGITSAEVARRALGASAATVRGQVLDGVSVWDVAAPEGKATLQVVVPGNVGAPETIVEALDSLEQ